MKSIMEKLKSNKAIRAIFKIIGGCIVCFLAPLILKSVLIQPLLGFFKLNVYVSKSIQFSVMTAFLLVVYYLYFKKTEKRPISELNFFTRFRESILGFIIGAGIISACMGTLSFSGMGSISWNGISGLVIFVFIYIFALAAFEEILFRGVIYRILEENFGLLRALSISAVLFASLHLFNPNATAIAFLSAGIGGVVMGLLFSASKNLWVPILFHTGWNFAQVVFGMNLSGMEEFSEYGIFKSRLSGPDILTGGEFGPENSIIALVLLLGFGFYVYKLYRRKAS